MESQDTSVWEPVPAVPATVSTNAIVAQNRPPASLEPALEAAILTSLTRPIASGETSAAGNARREAELRALFAKLHAAQSVGLGRRIDIERADDTLAQAFKRLVVERRVRLRAYIADARRRSAMAGR